MGTKKFFVQSRVEGGKWHDESWSHDKGVANAYKKDAENRTKDQEPKLEWRVEIVSED